MSKLCCTLGARCIAVAGLHDGCSEADSVGALPATAATSPRRHTVGGPQEGCLKPLPGPSRSSCTSSFSATADAQACTRAHNTRESRQHLVNKRAASKGTDQKRDSCCKKTLLPAESALQGEDIVGHVGRLQACEARAGRARDCEGQRQLAAGGGTHLVEAREAALRV